MPNEVEPGKEVELSPAEKLHQEMLYRGQETLSEAADLINKAAVERRRVITEKFFVENLLPVVRCQVRGEANDNISLWVNIANGFDNPITVVTAGGKETFVLPAPFIYLGPTIADVNQRYVDLRQIVQHQRHVIDSGDQRQTWEIEQQLVETLTPNLEAQAKLMSLMQLMSIYLRYQLPMQELLGPDYQEIMDLISGSESAQGTTAKAAVTYEAKDEDYEY